MPGEVERDDDAGGGEVCEPDESGVVDDIVLVPAVDIGPPLARGGAGALMMVRGTGRVGVSLYRMQKDGCSRRMQKGTCHPITHWRFLLRHSSPWRGE